jgi:esterase/lipase
MQRKALTVFLLAAGSLLTLLYFTSLFSISELVYPLRLTANTLAEEELSEKQQKLLIRKDIAVLPSQLNLPYRNFDVRVRKNFVINGWYINHPDQAKAPVVLLLHDWNESKISMLDAAEAFSQLGFPVCLIDLPAHGESDGKKFLMDSSLNAILTVVADSLYCLYETNQIAVMAKGVMGIAAARWLLTDQRMACLLLQDPINTMSDLLLRLVKAKWNGMYPLIYPLAELKYKGSTGIHPDSLNLSNCMKRLKTPLLVTINAQAQEEDVRAAVQIYDSSSAPLKKIWTNNSRSFIRSDDEKNIYRAMAAFINSAIPPNSPKVKSRKRIALLK